MQHGAEQIGLVLTITVAMRKDVGSLVRLPTTDTQLDSHITDVVLDKLSNSPHLFQRRGCRSRYSCNLLLNISRLVQAPVLQIPVPTPHLLPITEFLGRQSSRREKRYDHLAEQTPQRRHFLLRLHAFHVGDGPLPLIWASLHRLKLGIVEPGGFVLPTGGKLERVVAFEDWIDVLKLPVVLQDEGMLFDFVLVANNV